MLVCFQPCRFSCPPPHTHAYPPPPPPERYTAARALLSSGGVAWFSCKYVFYVCFFFLGDPCVTVGSLSSTFLFVSCRGRPCAAVVNKLMIRAVTRKIQPGGQRRLCGAWYRWGEAVARDRVAFYTPPRPPRLRVSFNQDWIALLVTLGARQITMYKVCIKVCEV